MKMIKNEKSLLPAMSYYIHYFTDQFIYLMNACTIAAWVLTE